MTPALFRILWTYEDPRPHEPGVVPWVFVEPHEAQALRNHSQTLEVLHSRGGLGVDELVAVLEGRKWHRMDLADARARLAELLGAWRRAHGFAE